MAKGIKRNTGNGYMGTAKGGTPEKVAKYCNKAPRSQAAINAHVGGNYANLYKLGLLVARNGNVVAHSICPHNGNKRTRFYTAKQWAATKK